MKNPVSFSYSDNGEWIVVDISNMFSHLQTRNLFHYIHSMQVFYILVLTSSIYCRIYHHAYLKKFCIITTHFYPWSNYS